MPEGTSLHGNEADTETFRLRSFVDQLFETKSIERVTEKIPLDRIAERLEANPKAVRFDWARRIRNYWKFNGRSNQVGSGLWRRASRSLIRGYKTASIPAANDHCHFGKRTLSVHYMGRKRCGPNKITGNISTWKGRCSLFFFYHRLCHKP